jgi:hypothetical protein
LWHSLVIQALKNSAMKSIFLSFFLLAAAAVHVNAQAPVPEPDTLKNQVRQIDPVPQTMPPDANYTATGIKITSAEFPDAVKKTLNDGPEYRGWEKGAAYKSKDGKMYILEMREADTVRTFRFDKSGKLILE